MRKIGLLGVLFAVILFGSGCGQQLKQENEQMKAQVTKLSEENVALRKQVSAIEKESADYKALSANAAAERDALKKEIEAIKAKSKGKKSGTAKPASKKAGKK